MKTIKDAVIELGGKYPSAIPEDISSQHCKLYVNSMGTYIPANDVCAHDFVCTRQEFEACAKSMGYINGYLWGKEYPTNGKRPDLADDMMVEVSGPFNGSFSGGIAVSRLDWSSKMFSFRVSDPRYKPVDEVSETERFGIMPPINKNERCSMQDKEYNWHERGELPPVGEKFILKGKHGIDRDEREAEVTYLSSQNIVFNLFNQYGEVSNEICYSLSDFDARYIAMPIRTEREKVFEAVDSLIHNYQAGEEIRTEFLDVLYNAGMLVLPPKKSDTKD